MTTFNISLTQEELNGILQTLAKLPYEQSYALIHNIQRQAQAAMQPAPPVEEPTP